MVGTPRRRLAMERLSQARTSSPPATRTKASTARASAISDEARVTWNSITASWICHIIAMERTMIARLTTRRTGQARFHFSHCWNQILRNTSARARPEMRRPQCSTAAVASIGSELPILSRRLTPNESSSHRYSGVSTIIRRRWW